MARKPKPEPRARKEPPLPPAVEHDFGKFVVDTHGCWLVINDLHIPSHDEATIRLAAGRAKKRGISGILINGDLLDSHELSVHDQDPTAPRYIEEVETARKFFL